VQNPIPIWIAVGGTPESVVRAGMLGLPLALAIIGGEPARFAPLVDLYRRAVKEGGHDPAKLPVSINSHGYIADTAAQAQADAFPPLADAMTRIGRERGWPPTTRDSLVAASELRGALFVGEANQAIEKILYQHEIFKHDRFLIQFSVGALPHKGLLRAIELFGTVVAPAVRKAVGAGVKLTGAL
jgi:alkanesulfonate monooxygenase SsuD/methylene tetrahydromethanopterin reductase-like flavin-dependent oxidoreductase (luciferase family)